MLVALRELQILMYRMAHNLFSGRPSESILPLEIGFAPRCVCKRVSVDFVCGRKAEKRSGGMKIRKLS